MADLSGGERSDNDDDDIDKKTAAPDEDAIAQHIQNALDFIKSMANSPDPIYQMEKKTNMIEIQPCESTRVSGSHVTYKFPLRIRLSKNEGGKTTTMTGTLRSPLRSPLDNKLYKSVPNVKIASLESLSDFLLLHLCLPALVARTVNYTTLSLSRFDKNFKKQMEITYDDGIRITFDAKTSVHMQIHPDMSCTIKHEDKTEQLFEKLPASHHHTGAAFGSTVSVYSADNDPQQYIEHWFGGGEPGQLPEEMHPTMKGMIGSILCSLLLPKIEAERAHAPHRGI